MRALKKSWPTSVNTMPRCSTIVPAPRRLTDSSVGLACQRGLSFMARESPTASAAGQGDVPADFLAADLEQELPHLDVNPVGRLQIWPVAAAVMLEQVAVRQVPQHFLCQLGWIDLILPTPEEQHRVRKLADLRAPAAA